MIRQPLESTERILALPESIVDSFSSGAPRASRATNIKSSKRAPRARVRARIRPYASGDLGFVRNLFSAHTDEEQRRLSGRGLHYSWDFDDSYLRTLTRAPRVGGIFLVGEVGGRPAGFVAATLKKPHYSWDATTRASGLVMELHVASEFRGLGLGRRLLLAAEKHFRSRGYDWISLGVFPTNARARAFYQKLGYQNVYVFMGKRLDPLPPRVGPRSVTPARRQNIRGELRTRSD